MITPQIKRFECLDHDPIESWIPADLYNVHYTLTVFIGPLESQAADMFYIYITSDDQRDGRDVVKKDCSISEAYSWNIVQQRVSNIVSRCSGETWDEVVKKLTVHMGWEFDNYQP